jgi:uncharacterized membrane protein
MELFKRPSSMLVTVLIVLKSLTILAQKPNLPFGDVNVVILTGKIIGCALVCNSILHTILTFLSNYR